jgi:hypothetical protein
MSQDSRTCFSSLVGMKEGVQKYRCWWEKEIAKDRGVVGTVQLHNSGICNSSSQNGVCITQTNVSFDDSVSQLLYEKN